MFERMIQGNRLFLNVIKTQAVVIGSRPNLKQISKKAVNSQTFVIDDSPAEVVESIKYLGGQVDRYLVLDERIRSIQTRVSRSLGINMQRNLYQSMFFANYIEVS